MLLQQRTCNRDACLQLECRNNHATVHCESSGIRHCDQHAVAAPQWRAYRELTPLPRLRDGVPGAIVLLPVAEVRATPIPLLLVEATLALEPWGLIEPLLLIVAALAVEAPALRLLLLGGVT